ncbi:hypothetical protein [Burkholderia cenocepacia]|uniref:hypothetical protein n=1 Tax=Burkholderia cenocepacia TaxID=95486 RepID=UPI0012371BBA|nr:hypothetical protein [Burkholderia cenocepacia]
MSKLVFHGIADFPALDAAEIERSIDITVNATAWSAGEILPMQIPSPDEAKAPVLRWLEAQNFPPAVLQDGDGLFLAEGSWFHHDADDYPDSLFCVQWLDETDPWDLLFPESDLRIALRRGTIVLLDPSNVHGVVYRGAEIFDQHGMGEMGVQLFSSLSLEMTPAYRDLFGISVEPQPVDRVDTTWLSLPFLLCPETGRLRRVGM